MKNITRFSLAVLMALAIILPTKLSATKHVINVQNYTFSPSDLSGVIVGDTIRWVWVSGSHTTTSTTIPVGAATWNSPISSTVTSFEYKVTLPGTYNYKCTPHANMGMVGTFTATSPLPTLAVSPENQNVTSAAGTTSFQVVSNSNWTSTCNRSWCAITTSGSGNGSLVAVFGENTTGQVRVAEISVSVTGLAPVVVTVTQEMSSLGYPEQAKVPFKVYPNPSTGVFNVAVDKQNTSPVELTISDAIGNVIKKDVVAGKDLYKLDLSEYSKGMYLLKLQSGDTSRTMKLLLVN